MNIATINIDATIDRTVPPEVRRAVTAEARKITTIRAGWILPTVCAAIGFVAAVLSAATGHGPQTQDALVTGSASVGLYVAVAVAVVAGGVFAALGAGGEYRDQSMPLTTLFTPDRELMLGAKLAGAAVFSLLLALAAEVGGVLGLLAGGADKIEFGLRLVAVLGGGLLTALCWGVFGVAIAVALRAARPAAAALLGWAIIIEPLIWLVLKGAGISGAAVLLPTSATIGTVAVGSFTRAGLFAPAAAAAVVLVAWVAAAGFGTWWYLRKREL
jgi:ABC-2 type transport system permease protein